MVSSKEKLTIDRLCIHQHIKVLKKVNSRILKSDLEKIILCGT
jgi:hypothetical protein